jgi:hypothetical protein
VVPKDTGCVVHECRDLIFVLAVPNDLFEKLDVVAPAGLDELFLDGRTLEYGQSKVPG